MGTRIKTFESTGLAPNGRLYAGDLNALEDQYADQSNLSQTLGVGVIQVGESGLQLVRYGSGEARITGALRTDAILRGLGGLIAGTFTTTQRNAISSPPYGLIILNTTTNQYEWNAGTPSVPNWQGIAPPSGTVGTSGIADGAVTSQKIADGTIVIADISGTLRPSVSAAAGDEALRALGTGAGNAAAGNDSRFPMPGMVAMWAASAAPSGWLLCQGQAVSRTTYAALFAAIGTSYGAGDGATTFNLPDAQGRMPVGVGTHIDVNALNKTEGVALASRRPVHKHTYNIQIWSNGNQNQPGSGTSGYANGGNSGLNGSYVQMSVGPQTGLEPLDSPAYFTINFIIKT